VEVLAEVKASEYLLAIPVVMLSTSQDEADVYFKIVEVK
jgi:hypothetical protein